MASPKARGQLRVIAYASSWMNAITRCLLPAALLKTPADGLLSPRQIVRDARDMALRSVPSASTQPVGLHAGSDGRRMDRLASASAAHGQGWPMPMLAAIVAARADETFASIDDLCTRRRAGGIACPTRRGRRFRPIWVWRAARRYGAQGAAG